MKCFDRQFSSILHNIWKSSISRIVPGLMALFIIFGVGSNSAKAGWHSCIDDDNIFNEIGAAIGTLGISLVIESGFSMANDEDAEGEKATGSCGDAKNSANTAQYKDGSKAACDDNNQPVIRCKTPVFIDQYSDPNYIGPKTDGIKFSMNGAASFFIGMWSGNTDGCNGGFFDGYTCKAKPGQKYGLLKNVRVITVGDKICVQYWSFTGWQSLGCKYIVGPPEINLMAGCYTGESCSNLAARKSLSFFPITGILMQCVRESIFKVFVDPSSCSGTNGMSANLFPAFQESMRKIVKILIMLTVIIFGIKIALGGNLPKKSEIFIWLIKIILVSYFAVGIYDAHSGRYEDGLTKYIIPGFVGAANELSSMIFRAIGSGTLCRFDVNEYDPNFSYLALWDALDCRVAYYLGFNNASQIAGVAMSKLFSFIVPGLFSFQIIFSIFCILFSIFIISITVYFVHTFVIALIALTIIAYLGPIFIPMALFGITRSYFDAWLKLMFSFALQPVIISAFMALMMTVFDQVFYGSCTWSHFNLPLTNLRFYYLDKSTDPDCVNTFGYNLDIINRGDSIIEFTAIFFDISILNVSVMVQLIKGMLAISLFAYLFYKFGEMLSGFAGEVSGGPSLGAMSVGPNAVVDAAIDLAMKYADSQTGGAASKAKEAGEKAGGDDNSKPRSGGVSATQSSSSQGSGVSATQNRGGTTQGSVGSGVTATMGKGTMDDSSAL